MGCLDGSEWQIDPEGWLSSGEYGVVYKATGEGGQKVVVKIMRLKPKNWRGLTRGLAASLDMFVTEIAAQSLAAGMDLAVPIRDYLACSRPGLEPTLGFIFMDMVQGLTLERWILQHSKPSQHHTSAPGVMCEPRHIGTKLGRGSKGYITGEMYTALLKAIPQLDGKGLIASDLHTANIMVDTSGPHEKMVFIDFGGAFQYEHQNHQAVKWVLQGNFGCPLPKSLKDVDGLSAKYMETVEDEDSEFDLWMDDLSSS